MIEPRQDADRGYAGQFFEVGRRRIEQGGVAVGPVEHEAGHVRALIDIKEKPRAVKVGERASPLDVGDDENPGPCSLRCSHVGDVPVVQIRLGRTSGSLYQEHVVLGCEFDHGPLNLGPCAIGSKVPRKTADLCVPFPKNHDFTPAATLRLDQNRIHAHIGLDTRCERLHVLSCADLATLNHSGVVRYVLRLERRAVDPSPMERPRDRGRDQRLAYAAGNALDHQRAHGVRAL